MKIKSLLGGIVLAASAATAGASSAAAAPDVRRVAADGMLSEYTASVDKSGALRLVGEDPKTGERFAFKARRDGSVTGFVNQRPVSFRVSSETVERALREAGKPAL
jgi:hypothetical protein